MRFLITYYCQLSLVVFMSIIPIMKIMFSVPANDRFLCTLLCRWYKFIVLFLLFSLNYFKRNFRVYIYIYRYPFHGRCSILIETEHVSRVNKCDYSRSSSVEQIEFCVYNKGAKHRRRENKRKRQLPAKKSKTIYNWVFIRLWGNKKKKRITCAS